MGDYITLQNLENAISPETCVELLDDDGDGVISPTDVVVIELIARAEADVNSYLMRAYPNLPLPVTQNPLSSMLREAALQFAEPMAYRRHPEYARTMGIDFKALSDRANAFMERICTGRQYLFDVPAEPVPATVGGIVTSSGPLTLIDGPDGTKNGGDF